MIVQYKFDLLNVLIQSHYDVSALQRAQVLLLVYLQLRFYKFPYYR
ncbi:hypothetical protein HanXRQr2_Chr06g0268281 [Helianthus annuus]|uniref:Uncharacterized protein n=1 Tax=Helianthus annuus TaxID=4232 RepID=A0A9K3IUF2_HELAN|nr:hypothetical protein HanXRQr2_Chr06g0268281 [Helianthus annuus]